MKPLLEESFDQLLHFGIGMVSVFVIDPPSAWQSAVLGLTLGVVREVTEDAENMLSWGSIRDIIFWTFGGLFGWWIQTL